jgi:hypothetical protein
LFGTTHISAKTGISTVMALLPLIIGLFSLYYVSNYSGAVDKNAVFVSSLEGKSTSKAVKDLVAYNKSL